MGFWDVNLHEILSFILGIITGVCGSFLTIKIRNSSKKKIIKDSHVVDQRGASAGRDVIGGNSSTKN